MADLAKKEKGVTRETEEHLGMLWKELLDPQVRLEREDQKD